MPVDTAVLYVEYTHTHLEEKKKKKLVQHKEGLKKIH